MYLIVKLNLFQLYKIIIQIFYRSEKDPQDSSHHASVGRPLIHEALEPLVELLRIGGDLVLGLVVLQPNHVLTGWGVDVELVLVKFLDGHLF